MSDASLKRRCGEESVVPASSIRHFLGQSVCTVLLQHPVISWPEHLLDIKSGTLLHFERAELVTIPITRSMSMIMAGPSSSKRICDTDDQTAHPSQPRAENMAQ